VTIVDADEILVLDYGVIVGAGNAPRASRDGGLYAAWWIVSARRGRRNPGRGREDVSLLIVVRRPLPDAEEASLLPAADAAE